MATLLRRAGAWVGERAAGLLPLELEGAPAAALFSRIHRVRLLIGVSGLGSVWLLPAPPRARLLLFGLVALLYVPWSFAITRAWGRGEVVWVRAGMLAGDLGIVAAIHWTVPQARYVAMLGYLLLATFYAQITGRGAGLVVCGLAVGVTVARELAGAGPRTDPYTLVMFAAALPSAVVLVEAVARVQRETALRAQRLYRSLQQVSSSAEVRAVLSSVVAEGARALGADGGVVLLREGDRLVEFGCTDPRVNRLFGPLRARAFSSPELPAVRAIRSGRPVVIEDAARYPHEGWRRAAAAMDVRSVLCAPIGGPGEAAGALLLWSRSPRRFSPRERDLACAFAEQASLALERARAYEREREAARRLRELDQLKSDFLSTVSHELRTPLTAIEGFALMLAERWDALPEDLRRDLVRRVARNARDLDCLVGQLLDFSRVERGALRFEPRPLELAPQVRACLEELEAVLAAHRLQVRVPEDLAVLADPQALRRILENLLTNAAKFSAAGTTIGIEAEALGQEVVLRVRDQGVGIPPQEQHRVFERFYRAGRADTAGRRGTGIGLAVVREFAEALGGRVWVESEVGRGSTFSVALPRFLPEGSGLEVGPPAVRHPPAPQA